MSIFLTGAAIVGALFGAVGHKVAKETNETAQKKIQEADALYNAGKTALEEKQKVTEAALLAFGTSKKEVMETSIQQFLRAYDRVKEIRLDDTTGRDKLFDFTIDSQDALELQEMSSIYQSAFSSGVAGAATGAVIALAASGSLPIVTGLLSSAGSLLTLGEVGMAAGLTGSALSFAATATPLSAIAAPVLLFSGFSASMKADENLEKAQLYHKQAQAAVEEMKISETLCVAIAERADMFNELLGQLNGMFSDCTKRLDAITPKKTKSDKKRISVNELSEKDLRIIAVTRALAGAVKAIIDVPLLDDGGQLSAEAQIQYDTIQSALPAFRDDVKELKLYRFPVSRASASSKQKAKEPTLLKHFKRLVVALLVCWMLSLLIGGLRSILSSDTSSGSIIPPIESVPSQDTHLSNSTSSSQVPNPNPSIPQSAPVDDMLPAQNQTDSVIITTTPSSTGENANAGTEDNSAVVVPVPEFGHTVDTIAKDLTSFRSLIINNYGIIYYINDNTVFNTANEQTINLSTDFDVPLTNAYLAYDSYNDITYLLAGESLRLYDISDFSSPLLVIGEKNYPDIAKIGQLEHNSYSTPQLAILADGSILVPIDLDGTHRIDPTTGDVERFLRLYDSASFYSKLVGNNIIKLRGDDKKATIIPINGENEHDIALERSAPYNNSSSVFSNANGIFYYEDGVGLCRIDTDGKYHVEVAQNDIRIDDHQSLDCTNIWSLAVSKNGSVAFYDNTLGCIRCIRPLN